MRLRDRLVFGLANLERGAGPALYMLIQHGVPRAMHLALGSRFTLEADIPYRQVGERTLRLDVLRPEKAGTYPVLIGIHGGAWMLGRKENIRHAGAYLARRGFVVVLIEYRLAPADRWPAAADDVLAAMRWVKQNAARYGGDGDVIGLFGDSAGGHLSAFRSITSRLPGSESSDIPRVGAAVHWYGVFDIAKFARIPWRRTDQIMDALFGAKANDEATRRDFSPRAYLDRVDTLPPTLLFAAGGDPLYSQSVMYARELRTRGFEVELHKYKASVHGFLNLPFTHECRDSLARSARFFDARLGHLRTATVRSAHVRGAA